MRGRVPYGGEEIRLPPGFSDSPVIHSPSPELIRRSQLDPTRDLQEMRQLVHDAVADYDERSLHGGLPALADLGEATKSVLDAVAGFGPLQPYLDDSETEETWI